MEVLNDLLGYKNMKIYQDDDCFKFSIDGVLLANFVNIKLRSKKILDIGTGTGIIPLIISTKTNIIIDAVEIQSKLYSLFKKSIIYNKLESQINLFNSDIKEFSREKENLNKYDIIISNPPYYSGKVSKSVERNIARNTDNLSLEDVVICGKKMLKDGGSLYLVYNSNSIDVLINVLSKHNMVLKRLKFVYFNMNKDSSIMLVECIKNGGHEVKIESPFILYNEDGSLTTMYSKILNIRK